MATVCPRCYSEHEPSDLDNCAAHWIDDWRERIATYRQWADAAEAHIGVLQRGIDKQRTLAERADAPDPVSAAEDAAGFAASLEEETP